MSREIIMASDSSDTQPAEREMRGGTFAFRIPSSFAAASQKLILNDLNANRSQSSFFIKKREDIVRFLKDPAANENELREVVIYLYGASSHFRRLIQYFVCLSDLSYVIAPCNIDTETEKPSALKRNYRKALSLISSMDIKNQFEKVLTVCLREDVFYGTIWEGTTSTIIQQLPSKYCKIHSIIDNVFSIAFNFDYFNNNKSNLEMYPEEFRKKYEMFRKNSNLQWQELDSPTSFAIKCNADTPNYAMPPFAGILREIYDLEDYKQLKMTKTEIDNYALLVMTLGLNDDGTWKMDEPKAQEFYHNLDDVIPEEIGSVLSPMPIEKISFERNKNDTGDTIAEAEQNLFTAAGVSSLLFNNEKASSNALLLSIKSDQAMTYGIVKSIQCVINRFLHSHSYGKKFNIRFLDCSPFNRRELGDSYLKACTYGIPMISCYCASQGMGQEEMDAMNFLEDDILGIKERFIPLMSSSTQSGKTPDDRGAGRPKSNIEDLKESGEQSRDRGEE